MPVLSVVIPLWNKEDYIGPTLRSVMGQTFRDFEVIIVDDGSSDRSVDVVKSFNDKRVRLITQENSGDSAARNRGIAEANSELIAFIDADDLWKPTFLETILRLYNTYPEAGIFATAYRLKMADGHFERPKHRHVPSHPWEGLLPRYFRAALSRNPVVMPSAVMIKKEVFNRLGGFPQGEFCEDLETWARIAFHYPIAWSSRTEMIYRRDVVSSEQKTRVMDKDLMVIETLKNGLNVCQESDRRDIRDLIGKYYKFSATLYARSGNRENALRCVRESLRYSSGFLMIKPVVLGMMFSVSVRIWGPSIRVQTFYDKCVFKVRRGEF